MQTDFLPLSSATATAQVSAPTILLTATLRWPIAARLAMAFAAMGCRIDVVCPRQHPATRTRAIRHVYRYTALRPLRSLQAAIEAAAPDFVIACDDDAAIDLQRLYARSGAADLPASSLRGLIARSLGSPDACVLATARAPLMSLAAEEGVRIPATAVVGAPSELDIFLRQHKFPVVMKVDSTWGGQGVSIVQTHEEARRAFDLLSSRPSMAGAMTRLLLDRDPSVLLNSLKKAPRTVIVQEFIAGTPANRAVACWQGQVLAGISVEAIRTLHPTGPATVVQGIENTQMSEAVDRVVRRLGVSGLWGFDFVLQASTGAAYLVEANPRATPVCHLPLGAGQGLAAALYTRLTGSAPHTAPAQLEHATVVMFPGEWHRDPGSPYLRSHYHDVPWDEPALVQDCIDRPWSERGLIARAWAQIRLKASDPPSAPRAFGRQARAAFFTDVIHRLRQQQEAGAPCVRHRTDGAPPSR
jgi:glutathione synthase/RimK-type ligase-like ATP-grasp enzyme